MLWPQKIQYLTSSAHSDVPDERHGFRDSQNWPVVHLSMHGMGPVPSLGQGHPDESWHLGLCVHQHLIYYI